MEEETASPPPPLLGFFFFFRPALPIVLLSFSFSSFDPSATTAAATAVVGWDGVSLRGRFLDATPSELFVGVVARLALPLPPPALLLLRMAVADVAELPSAIFESFSWMLFLD
jgi:hypothetical protein